MSAFQSYFRAFIAHFRLSRSLLTAWNVFQFTCVISRETLKTKSGVARARTALSGDTLCFPFGKVTPLQPSHLIIAANTVSSNATWSRTLQGTGPSTPWVFSLSMGNYEREGFTTVPVIASDEFWERRHTHQVMHWKSSVTSCQLDYEFRNCVIGILCESCESLVIAI